MGKQVNFFVNQADITLLQEEAVKKGMLTIDGLKASKAVAREITQTDRLQTYYFLADKELASEIEYVPYRNFPKKIGATISDSPIIEFIVCPKTGNRILHPGRLYFGVERKYPFYNRVDKLYSSLMRKVKKWEKTACSSYYIGPDAYREAKEGRLELYFDKKKYSIE